MAGFERLAALYFAGLAVASIVASAPVRRRATVAAAALAAAAAVAWLAANGNPQLRVWAPHAYLVAGYWLPALLTRAPRDATPFEQWLVRWDSPLRERLPDVPSILVGPTELAYLLCYPLVPAAFAVVWSGGSAQDVSRFWVAVLGAGFACYVSIPWLVSRPPRLLVDTRGQTHRVRALNVRLLGRVSHQLNTFPSGHVAVSTAAAAMAASVVPAAGAAVALFAGAIAVGAAAGRYHYVIDVLLAVAVAAIAAGLAFMTSASNV